MVSTKTSQAFCGGLKKSSCSVSLWPQFPIKVAWVNQRTADSALEYVQGFFVASPCIFEQITSDYMPVNVAFLRLVVVEADTATIFFSPLISLFWSSDGRDQQPFWSTLFPIDVTMHMCEL